MDTKNMNEKALRKYLLGMMSVKKQEAAELWLMCNKESCELLEAAEDDLIDDFLAGKLKSRDRIQFMNHFLGAPERKHKLQFGSTLKRYIDRVAPQYEPASEPLSIWQKTAGLFSNRLASACAMAAMFAVLLIGAPLSYIKISDLGKELKDKNVRLSNLQNENKDLEELDHLQDSEILILTQGMTDRTADSGILSPIKLNQVSTRSSNNIQEYQISTTTPFIIFSLVLLDDDYDKYNVTLLNAVGTKLWAVNGLKATTTPEGKSVDIAVPGALFPTGEYSWSLTGASDSQPPESINDFTFRSIEH